MSHREFNQLLTSLRALSPEQLAALRRELDRKLSEPVPAGTKVRTKPAEETVFEAMERSGFIGCLKGLPHTPSDLSTNPKHMEGFGGG
jgi:hypothetical protein